MSEPDSELRVAVAVHHGLDRRAARFLTGGTIEELEASAASLAGLIGEREEPDPVADAPSDLFGGAAVRKAQRQRAILGALTGRQPQPRDEGGRFTARSFDGGAREPIPARRSPEAEHGQLIGQLTALSRTFRG
jgi:hypothetical protein